VASYIEELAKTSSPAGARNIFKELPDSVLPGYPGSRLSRTGDDVDRDKRFPNKWIRLALTWMANAKQPLTIDELLDAVVQGMCIEEEVGDDAKAELQIGANELLNVCGGYILVHPETKAVSFCHWTVAQWAADGVAFPFVELGSQCIRYLESVAADEGPCDTDHAFETRLARNPFYGYAATHWGHHVSNIEEDEVVDFLTVGDIVQPAATAAFQAHFVLCNMTKEEKENLEKRVEGYSQCYPKQTTVVHLAAVNGLEDVMYGLLDKYRPGRCADEHQRTPLWYAVDKGHVRVVRTLLASKRFDPNEEDVNGESPLKRAEEMQKRKPKNVAEERSKNLMVIALKSPPSFVLRTAPRRPGMVHGRGPRYPGPRPLVRWPA
jgi:hypothetical protein